MSDKVQVTVDDEPFLFQINQVDNAVKEITSKLNAKSPTTICLDCDSPIGEARKLAVPSAFLCTECQGYRDAGR